MLEIVDALMVIRGGALEMIGPPEAVYDHLKRTAAITSPSPEECDADDQRKRNRTVVKARYDANPARPARIGIAVIVLFVVAFGAWNAVAPVSGAAVAQGSLQVEGQRQAVQHPYGGIVKALKVKEGDRVERGQVLLTLFDTKSRARLNVLTAERDSLLAQEARLEAERDGANEPAFPEALRTREQEPGARQAMANERALMSARSVQYATERSTLQQRISQLEEQIRGSEAQLNGIERQRSLLEEEAQARGSCSPPDTRLSARARAGARPRQAGRRPRSQDGRHARAKEAIGEATLEITKLERTRTTELTDLLRTTQSRLVEVGPKLEAAKDILDRTEIVAPATGTIVGLSVFTEGGVIQQGAKLMDIVPSTNPLIVAARLRLTDVNEVTPGRAADVRLTSINRSERPNIRGTVMTVSADQITDERSGQGYYSLQVRMDAGDLKGSPVDLQAGMPAEVVVTTRPRTLIQYLISPLTDEVTRAFREQ